MKKLYILMIALFIWNMGNAQTYTITFAGIGAATTVDSVKVENLTHPATVIWHTIDVFQLQLGNGINEIDYTDDNLQVYPNPMQGQSEILFYAKQAGNATLSIYDIAGKEILQFGNKLLQGIQKYQLTSLKQGMYFINITGNGYFYTAKLISQNTTPCEAKIKYIGNEKPEITTLKSTKATITMPYTSGDNLRFTGYSGNLTAIVNDVPTSSKTITFTFVPDPSIILQESFAASIGNFTQFSVTGVQIWVNDPVSMYMKMSGYANGSTFANEDWLISPALNLTQHTNIKFSFESAMRYGTIGDGSLKVYYSTNYSGTGNPNTATWTEFPTCMLPTGDTWAFTPSGNIDFTIGGTHTYVAFRYVSTASSAATWELKNVLVKGQHVK